MIVNDPKHLGKVLKNRRRQKKYTQAYMSEFTGLSTSFISNIENGKETCEIGKVISYANMLGMDIEIKARGEQNS